MHGTVIRMIKWNFNFPRFESTFEEDYVKKKRYIIIQPRKNSENGQCGRKKSFTRENRAL